ncbi:MAG TPA: hypothetical protein VFS42_04555, partial [Burkholderiaceae bacterium]|nr:hypothetical protein [Burkholderiaceae bacterium]
MLIVLQDFQKPAVRERLERHAAQLTPADVALKRANTEAAVTDAAERLVRCERALLDYGARLDYRPGFVRTDAQREMFDRLASAYNIAM